MGWRERMGGAVEAFRTGGLSLVTREVDPDEPTYKPMHTSIYFEMAVDDYFYDRDVAEMVGRPLTVGFDNHAWRGWVKGAVPDMSSDPLDQMYPRSAVVMVEVDGWEPIPR